MVTISQVAMLPAPWFVAVSTLIMYMAETISPVESISVVPWVFIQPSMAMSMVVVMVLILILTTQN